MNNICCRLPGRSWHGQSLAEYGLALALIAVVGISGLGMLGQKVGDVFTHVAEEIGAATVGGGGTSIAIAGGSGSGGGGTSFTPPASSPATSPGGNEAVPVFDNDTTSSSDYSGDTPVTSYPGDTLSSVPTDTADAISINIPTSTPTTTPPSSPSSDTSGTNDTTYFGGIGMSTDKGGCGEGCSSSGQDTDGNAITDGQINIGFW